MKQTEQDLDQCLQKTSWENLISSFSSNWIIVIVFQIFFLWSFIWNFYNHLFLFMVIVFTFSNPLVLITLIVSDWLLIRKKTSRAIKTNNYYEMLRIIIVYPLTSSFATQWFFSLNDQFNQLESYFGQDELNDFFSKLITSEKLDLDRLTSIAYYLKDFNSSTQKSFFMHLGHLFKDKKEKPSLYYFYSQKIHHSSFSIGHFFFLYVNLLAFLIIMTFYLALIFLILENTLFIVGLFVMLGAFMLILAINLFNIEKREKLSKKQQEA